MRAPLAAAIAAIFALVPACTPKPNLSGTAATNGIAVLTVEMDVIEKIDFFDHPIEALVIGETVDEAEVQGVRITPWGGDRILAPEAILNYSESFLKTTPSQLYLWSNLAPGRYQLAQVHGRLVLNEDPGQAFIGIGEKVPYHFTAPSRQIDELSFTVNPGEFTYLGKVIVAVPRDTTVVRREKSYRVDYSAGLERKALERMIKSYGDTEWGPALNRRLVELED